MSALKKYIKRSLNANMVSYTKADSINYQLNYDYLDIFASFDTMVQNVLRSAMKMFYQL